MRNKREVKIGNVTIGGENKIAVQSMTNTDTKDVKSTVAQINALEKAGCEIVRSAFYDVDCTNYIKDIKKGINIPLVADIHFDYKIALGAIKNGIDKIRINPGNIGEDWKIREVVKAANDFGVPIRVGGNTGSLPKDVLEKYGVCAKSLVLSAQRNIEILEDMNFRNIVVSLKSSDVLICREAYEIMNEKNDYPLHLGVTEAGTILDSAIKSSACLGALLMEDIGDTIRISVSGDPVSEIGVAKKLLKCCGKLSEGVEIVSCPTCARCTLDIETLAGKVADYTKDIKKPLKIAVMGCAVNGPGEAKNADFGVAGGGGNGLIFEKGKTLKKVPESELFDNLKELIEKYKND